MAKRTVPTSARRLQTAQVLRYAARYAADHNDSRAASDIVESTEEEGKVKLFQDG